MTRYVLKTLGFVRIACVAAVGLPIIAFGQAGTTGAQSAAGSTAPGGQPAAGAGWGPAWAAVPLAGIAPPCPKAEVVSMRGSPTAATQAMRTNPNVLSTYLVIGFSIGFG